MPKLPSMRVYLVQGLLSVLSLPVGKELCTLPAVLLLGGDQTLLLRKLEAPACLPSAHAIFLHISEGKNKAVVLCLLVDTQGKYLVYISNHTS